MNNYPPFKFSFVGLTCIFLAGCVAPPKAPDALNFERVMEKKDSKEISNNNQNQNTTTQFLPGPRSPEILAGNIRPDNINQNKNKEISDLTVSLEQIPLNSFIHAIYGGILKVNYSIDAAINERKDLVTFRTPKPISSKRLMDVSSQLLKSYGIAVQNFDGVIRITSGSSIASTLPIILRGRALPTVPQPLRPIFHYIETESVKPESFFNTLKSIVGDRVKVEVTQLGGLLISGPPDDVQSALEIVRVFDQPSLRGQHNIRIIPRYWSAEEFARKLNEVLRAEGYSVGIQNSNNEPISLLTLPSINSVLVFSVNRDVLLHVVEWAKELDQINAVQAGGSLFTYSVKNSDAQELAKSLNELINGSGDENIQKTDNQNRSSSSASSVKQKRVVVNNATNSLIFQGGTQEDYRQWLSLLVELDKPTKSALIDVLVAEVSLKDENDLGFSWKLDQLGSGAAAVRLSGTTYGMTAGTNGLTINALLGGNPLRQLAINALATNSDSRVISNPKIVTKNGETANINVGEEVPTVTSQAVTNNGLIGGNNSVVPQTVQYRSTGILLKVRPVIHSGDRIDIEVSQEVSSAEPTVTGVTTSPTIRKRSVDTKISLRDGATIMLGGLISESSTDSNSGVPLLKDIPGIGNLFKSSKRSRDRTELVILITPYILNDSTDAEAATDAYHHTLGKWADSVRERVRSSRDAQLNRRSISNEKISDENQTYLNVDSTENLSFKKNNDNEHINSSVEVKNFTPDKMILIRDNVVEKNYGDNEVLYSGDEHLKRSFPTNAVGLSKNNDFSNEVTPTSNILSKEVENIGVPSQGNNMQGAKVVDDPELLKELLKSIGK